MIRLLPALLFALSAAVAAPVAAGSQSGSFQVSVTVLPPPVERVPALVPVAGFQRMENANGEHWIVETSAADAIKSYVAQLAAAGYQALDGSGLQWSNGTTAVMISAQDALGSMPVSRLSVVAYDIKRQQARLAAAPTRAMLASN